MVGRALVALLLAPVVALSAQQTFGHVGNVHFVVQSPACNPLAQRFDPVWVNGWGWTMPRVAWHALYPTLNYGVAKGLHRTGLDPKVAALTATIALGLVPHVRQAALGLKHGNVYELNAPDWLFDLWNRSLPSWVAASTNHRTTRRDVAVWAAGDVLLSCFASP